MTTPSPTTLPAIFPSSDTQNPRPLASAIRTQFRAPFPPSQAPNHDDAGTALYAARTPRYVDICARYAMYHSQNTCDAGVVAGSSTATTPSRVASLAARCRAPDRHGAARPEP